jgi:hypothetical protein
MIRFVCECGKQLQARDDSAGKIAICPACQRQLTVPHESPPLEAVQTERPIRRDEVNLEEEPEIEGGPSRHQPAGASREATASLILGVLSLFCNVLASVPAVILAILALRDIDRSRGRLSGHGLAIAGVVTAVACTLLSCMALVPFSIRLFIEVVESVREAPMREQSTADPQSTANLVAISQALRMYNHIHNTLPSAGFNDLDKPPRERRALLSWRVAILPYLGQLPPFGQDLYSRFRLNEPWDGPNNLKLLEQMPATYKLPGDDKTPPGYTHYQVFVGNGAAFDRTEGYFIPVHFPDGLDQTILVVEAEKAVPWTKPEDVDFDPNKPMLPLMSRYFRRGFHVLMASGTIRLVDPKVSENTFKAAITRNGGDALGSDWEDR